MSFAPNDVAAIRWAAGILRPPKHLLLAGFALLVAVLVPIEGKVVLPGLITATTIAVLLDLGIAVLEERRLTFPDGALLTGVIIALVLRPEEPLYVPALAAIVAIGGKRLLRTHRSNIFNPAALGIVAVGVVFSSGESWWGALPDLTPFSLLLLLVCGLLLVDYVNKLPLVLVFLGVYFGLFCFVSFFIDPTRVAEVFRTPDVEAVVFFACVMLDDPPTCPVRYEDQAVFAIICAWLAFAIFVLMGSVYYLALALLAANGWESARRLLYPMLSARAHRPAMPVHSPAPPPQPVRQPDLSHSRWLH